MNLETLASPPGAGDVSAAGACSLTSLLSISCRSRAEAAQSFAKKLHNKLWFFGPSLSSADGQFSSSRLSGEGGEETKALGPTGQTYQEISSKSIDAFCI